MSALGPTPVRKLIVRSLPSSARTGLVVLSHTCRGERHLDAAVLRAALGRAVRGNRITLTESLCTDKLRLHALRDHILHHGFGTLFRQHLVRSNALLLQAWTDGSIVGIAVHHKLILLLRRQFFRQLGDDVLPSIRNLPAA